MSLKLIKAIAVIAGCLVVFGSVESATKRASQPPATLKRIFVAGCDKGIENLKTLWPNRSIQWMVQSEAGKVAAGEGLTDAKGKISLEFPVPDVRTAVHLALVLNPKDAKLGSLITVDVIVLPIDPLADVRYTLGKLDIGLLSGGPLAAVLEHSSLDYTQLQHDISRSNFKGKIVILDGLLGENLEATRAWIESLPEGTCIIIVNSEKKERLLPLVGCLSKQSDFKGGKLFWDKDSPAWTGLKPQWLGAKRPIFKLGQPRWIISLRVLTGRITDDGTVYPLLLETRSTNKHRWLIWNLSESFPKGDPRWDLILRNSLLWARSHLTTNRKR